MTQTPQIFEKETLLKAYNRFQDRTVYDDSQLLELLGEKVKIAEGSYFNMKVTYPYDLKNAAVVVKALAKK